MSDILSQEQIDALLTGFGTDSGSSGFSTDSTQETSEVDRNELISSTLGLFFQQANSVITTVINKKTTFIVESCQSIDFSKIKEKIPSVTLSLKLGFKTGFEGDCFLIIQKKDVALLSDLMMMGDGSAEYSEDHKDAIGELFNQVMGAYTTALGSEMGIPSSAEPIEVLEFDIDAPDIPQDDSEMLIVSLEIEEKEKSYISVIVPKAFADQIVEKNSSTASSQKSSGNIGLNMSEIDELSKVTAFDSGHASDFTETNIAGVPVNAPRENIDMLLDIDLDVSIELGRSLLSIKRILELAPGSIVELDRMAGEPVDLLVNNKVVARGEVVVIDESFGIRIVSLVSPEERIKSLR